MKQLLATLIVGWCVLEAFAGTAPVLGPQSLLRYMANDLVAWLLQ